MPVLDGVVNRDYWDPEVLTTIARREQALFDLQNPDSFAELFPSEEVSDIRAAIEYGPEIDDIVVANFRTFSGTATSERFGETQKAYFQLALISRNYVFDEKTLYEIRNSKKDIASPAIESYVKRAAKAIAMSAAVQRANILYNDKVELQMPNAPTQVINCGRKPEFKITAPKLFTDPTANPLDQIYDWKELYREENGFYPEVMHAPEKVMRAIANHPTVAKQANLLAQGIYIGTNDPAYARTNRTRLERLMSEIFEIPGVQTATTARFKVDNLHTGQVETKQLCPQDTILLTTKSADPAKPETSTLGRTYWGETLSAEALGVGGNGGIGAPGLVAGVINKNTFQVGLEVMADAIMLPVCFKPNYIFTAKVI